MSHVFNIDNMNDFNEKINIDELYEKKKHYDLSKLEIFNKLLNRVHTKIKITSRQRLNVQYCWFAVPEVMIGVPKYDQGACISYIMDKLIDNGFLVKYIHPNVILISWKHWIPDYVRNEIKKKTGMEVDSYGKLINKNEKSQQGQETPFKLSNKYTSSNKDDKKFKPIKDYKPLGNLIYNEELLTKLENRLS
tara:strand:+ start:2868 stop:3443 length:576 start_codon:yes stop_codon:yes gene_type:complete